MVCLYSGEKEVIRWGIGKRAEPPFLWFGYLGGAGENSPLR